MNALVSVIVPCYNQAEFISQTLDSVFSQTFKDWECIIVDDGSSDNSKDIVERFVAKDSRFKYIYQENQGPSVARNTGILQSQGTYILPLDADDLIAETYIEKAIAVFKNQPDIKLVYCRAQLFGSVNEKWDLPLYSYDRLIWDNIIFCSALYKRSDYDKTSGYNPNMRSGWEDWDFWLSFLKPDDKVYCFDEVMFFYRIKTSSRNTHVVDKERDLCQRIYTNHPTIYGQYNKDLIYFKQQYLHQCELLSVKENEIRNSHAYRVGVVIMKPIKWIKSIFIHK